MREKKRKKERDEEGEKRGRSRKDEDETYIMQTAGIAVVAMGPFKNKKNSYLYRS